MNSAGRMKALADLVNAAADLYYSQKTDRRKESLIDVAMKYAEGWCRMRRAEDDDLKGQVMIGVIKALQGFDTEKGVLFSTYLSSKIESEALHYFRDSVGLIRLPTRLKEFESRYRRAVDMLSAVLGRTPSLRELAAHLNVSEDWLIEAERMLQVQAQRLSEVKISDDMKEHDSIETMLGKKGARCWLEPQCPDEESYDLQYAIWEAVQIVYDMRTVQKMSARKISEATNISFQKMVTICRNIDSGKPMFEGMSI